ncbi:MAG TPA: hypothetical protein VN325_34375 [Steroidobacteraceae bacterium]|jgi:hypothetical protein|nr:hypothetical protein [Steroidobacteraceae bacterium]
MMVSEQLMNNRNIAVCLAACLLLAGNPGVYAADAKSAAVATTAQPEGAAAWHARFGERYKRDWGVEIVGVRPVSSGYMLRFAYRVLDPAKAAPLFDERTKPYLFDATSGARLAVPAMENIGELRQTPKPVADRTYFTIFGNPGKLVQSGGRVRIVIGKFEIDDLIVE